MLQGKKGEHQRTGQDAADKPVGRTTQTHRLAVDVGASFGHQSGHVPAAVFGRPVKSRLSGSRRRVHHKVLLQCSGSVSGRFPPPGCHTEAPGQMEGWFPAILQPNYKTTQHSAHSWGRGGQPLVTGGED